MRTIKLIDHHVPFPNASLYFLSLPRSVWWSLWRVSLGTPRRTRCVVDTRVCLLISYRHSRDTMLWRETRTPSFPGYYLFVFAAPLGISFYDDYKMTNLTTRCWYIWLPPYSEKTNFHLHLRIFLIPNLTSFAFRSDIPEEFMKQFQKCSEQFMNYQNNMISNNIRTYEMFDPQEKGKLHQVNILLLLRLTDLHSLPHDRILCLSGLSEVLK